MRSFALQPIRYSPELRRSTSVTMIVTLDGPVHPAFRGISPTPGDSRQGLTRPDWKTTVRVSFAVLVIGLLTGCSPELNWREWRTSEIGLTQLFPCKPIRQQRRVELAGREQVLVLQICDVADVTWAVAHADVGDPAVVGPALKALKLAAQLNVGAAPAASTPAQVEGATPNDEAGRSRLNGRAPDGRELAMALLVFAKGTVIVQMTALGSQLPDEAVDTFLGSSRVAR